MSKWFEIGSPYTAYGALNLWVRVYTADVVNLGFTGRNDHFDLTFQGKAKDVKEDGLTEFFGGRLVEQFPLDSDYVDTVAQLLRKLRKLRQDKKIKGFFDHLVPFLTTLKAAGFQPCQYHRGADQAYSVKDYPEAPCWTARNGSLRVPVFAADLEQARRLALRGFAERCAVEDRVQKGYAEQGLEQWLAEGRQMDPRELSPLYVSPYLAAAGFAVPARPEALAG